MAHIEMLQSSVANDSTKLRTSSHGAESVREVRLVASTEFIDAIFGNLMTMPGLNTMPNAERSRLGNGQIEGLS